MTNRTENVNAAGGPWPRSVDRLGRSVLALAGSLYNAPQWTCRHTSRHCADVPYGSHPAGWLAGWLCLQVACLHIAVDWLWLSCLLECLVFMCWRAVVIVDDYSPKCAS